MTDPPSSPVVRGEDHFRAAYAVTVGTWLVSALLQLPLFLRPSPCGARYVHHPDRYLFHAMFYDVLGAFLLALPFLLVWLVRYRRPLTSPRWRALHVVQIAVCTLAVALNHADHEVMRFAGSHLTPSYVANCLLRGPSWKVLWDTLAQDRGGPFLPIAILFLAPLALVLWSRRSVRRIGVGTRRPVRLRWAVAAVALPLVVTGAAHELPGGVFRIRRVQPWLLTTLAELDENVAPAQRPSDYDRLSVEASSRWQAGERAAAWSFPDPELPLVRVPVRPMTQAARPWNVILFQFESLRTRDTGWLGVAREVSPTPFLDRLAGSPQGAFWPRHVSFGFPTVTGFMSMHCSLPPHSRYLLATRFPNTELLCLPQVLRAHGWTAEFFTGSDPDWANERIFLTRWYDRDWSFRDADEADREVFRRAGERLLELGAGDRPFLATIVTISNHYPFRSREPAMDIAPYEDDRDRVLNTVHYTDDAIRELVESFRGEPWFARTLIVVVGDHGYNLGEHDGIPGQRNVYQESIAVPLLIWGDHPALPRGRQEGIASLLDLAPTVAELVGIQDPNPWLGHSLLRPPTDAALVAGASGDFLFAQDARFSLVTDEASGAAWLFDALADPEQRRDIADRFPEETRRLRAAAVDQRILVDYLIEANSVWTAAPR
jgi:membrane-anchored protein YejM (alkaline phosphatase superfamily)